MTTVLRRFLVAFASVLALVAIAAVPGVGSASFSAPADLSAPGQNAASPQVAVGPDGATTITWVLWNGSNDIIQARTRPAGSDTFGTAVALSESGQNASSPQVAVGPHGATTITWARGGIIQARTRPAGSDTFGLVVDLSESGENALTPQVAVGPSGATTITWARPGGNNNIIIQAATRPAGSDDFGAVVNVSVDQGGRQAFNPQVAVGLGGATTITWMFSNGMNEIIQASTRPAGQADFSDAVNLSGIAAYDPQVAVGSDGATTITWRRYDPNSIIQARTRPAVGGDFSAAVNLSGSGAPDAEAPQVAVGPDGATTITWTRGGIIQAATRPAGGAFPNPADVVNLSATGQNAVNPQVAVGPGGATTITWQRNGIIQARTRPAGSDTFGAVADLSADGLDAYVPQVAIGLDGATTITWYREDEDDEDITIIQASSSEATHPRLSVTRDGSGTGSVTSEPAGINCGATCGAYFAIGSSVTLTATAASGSVHSGWSGGCTGTSSTCVVTLSAATSVVASFGVAPAGVAGDPVNTFTMKLLKRSVLSITTQLNLPGAGKVVQVGTTRSSTRAGEMVKKVGTMIVCTARKTVAKAGKVTIICRLTAKARAARKMQSLKVRLVTTFTPTGGTAKSVTRTLVLKKTGSPAPQNVEPVTG